MYPNEFAYQAPSSLADVLTLLQQGQQNGSEVKVLAGGQSLIPLLKLRLAGPSALVDVSKVAELHGISEEGNGLLLGAMTTYVEAINSEVVQRRCPLMVQALRQVGDPQVRARGTIGGSMAHADPAGDFPAVAVALDAEVRAQGPNGSRSIFMRDFFVDLLTTSLQPTEVLTGVYVHATDHPRTGTAYVKHRHPASGYAVVGVAAVVRLGDDGSCQGIRIGITGASSRAVRATSVEQAIAGKQLDDATVGPAASSAADGLDLMSDNYASSDYRAHLTQVMTKRAIMAAADVARSR
ncbi:MAG TPA: xanthine dehydrogenase family protein subunit M [Ktedonobacterales bacterium]|nr:xanthine dehydrogenase family protein subunit M [Ktedonobacterales bacterium]